MGPQVPTPVLIAFENRIIFNFNIYRRNGNLVTEIQVQDTLQKILAIISTFPDMCK